MQIEKQIVLDILDIPKPALSANSDMPVIETKPDSTPAPEKAKATDAAPDGKKPDGEKPAESAPAEAKAEVAAKPEDSSASDETDEAAEPAKPKAKGVQKRIDELTRQREDERRLREATEARLDRALAAVERLTGRPASEAKQEIEQDDPEPVRPVKAQFPDEVAYDAARDDYTETKAAWIARREIKATIAERERQAAESRAAEENTRVVATYRQRVEKVLEKHADYTEVAESPDVSITVPMAHAIMASEYGPELQYHLGKNPAEAERLSKLPIPQQLLALGRLEASFASAAAPKAEVSAPETKPAAAKPAVSSAPPPTKPVKAGNADAVKTPEEMSMEEYAAYRKPQLEKQRKPGARVN
jgi:hypothetical protein